MTNEILPAEVTYALTGFTTKEEASRRYDKLDRWVKLHYLVFGDTKLRVPTDLEWFKPFLKVIRKVYSAKYMREHYTLTLKKHGTCQDPNETWRIYVTLKVSAK